MDINHVELFSGIGGFRQAFDLLAKDTQNEANCIAFSEIDKNATTTYKANFNTKNCIEMGDIVAFVNSEKLKKLPDFQILTGGFPCQAFSMMGKQEGFNDIRGNVFFQIIKLIKVKKPKYILLENVRNLVSHNHGKTFQTVLEEIKTAGYPYIYYDIFNTNKFGLAQQRRRIFIFASRVELPQNFEFSEKKVLNAFKSLKKTSLLKQESVLDVLEKNVDKKYYLSDIIKPTILSDGSKNFKSKSSINPIIARPLTATMVKMHRACQDNYFSDEFIHSNDPVAYLKKEFSKSEQLLQHIRRITPKEAFLLQGFSASFFEKAFKAGVSDHQLYKQAGNAVSVNTVYAVLYYLFIKNSLLG